VFVVDAVTGEDISQSGDFGESLVLFASGLTVEILDSEKFVLESLDVLFLALTVCPLGLTVEFLATGQGRFAVGFWTTTFLRLTICGQIRIKSQYYRLKQSNYPWSASFRC